MTAVGPRLVAAAAALKPLGLYLLVSLPDKFVITVNEHDPTNPVAACTSIEQVEEFIAERTQTAKAVRAKQAAPLESAEPHVCDPVHYVSHGSPVREDGTQAYKSVCRAAIVTEVYEMDDVPEHGVPYVGLFVINSMGTFHDQGVRYDPGTFTGPERTAIPGEPLPPVTCSDLAFEGGTWHWPDTQAVI